MPDEKPRIWPALVVGVGLVPFTWGCWFVLYGLVLLVEPSPLSELFEGDSPAGFLIGSVLGETFTVALLIVLARRSSESPWQRFALGPGRLSLWLLPIVFIGAVAASSVGGTLQALLFDTGSELKTYYDDVLSEGVEGSLFAFLVVMAVLPAITEELLFRGYVQSRLLRRLPAGLAILIASVLFAAAHIEPQYALAVLPLGLWLGYVAYLADSIWHSMLTHFFGNGIIVLAFWLVEADPAAAPAEELAETVTLLELIVPSLILLACAGLLRSRQRRVHAVIPLDVTRP